MSLPFGVVDVVYGRLDDPVARSIAARDDGYAHVDTLISVDPETLALPVGCPTSFPKPVDAWCTTPAPALTLDGAWERAVKWWQRAPQALLEPWAGACVNSMESFLAFRAEVPGVRLLVDTGHVADWGGDPIELLEYADHVQLRQGRPGHTQLHVDDPSGVVDFDAVFAKLDALDYRGKISIEYFNLPGIGWELDDPEGWARDLANALRGSRPDR